MEAEEIQHKDLYIAPFTTLRSPRFGVQSRGHTRKPFLGAIVDLPEKFVEVLPAAYRPRKDSIVSCERG